MLGHHGRAKYHSFQRHAPKQAKSDDFGSPANFEVSHSHDSEVDDLGPNKILQVYQSTKALYTFPCCCEYF